MKNLFCIVFFSLVLVYNNPVFAQTSIKVGCIHRFYQFEAEMISPNEIKNTSIIFCAPDVCDDFEKSSGSFFGEFQIKNGIDGYNFQIGGQVLDAVFIPIDLNKSKIVLLPKDSPEIICK